MDKHSIYSIAIGAAILVFLLGAYICNFCHNGISDVNQDWAGFADYMGLGTGLISVVLLYATFMEQRRTNNQEIFDKRFYNACDIITKMQETYRGEMSKDEDELSEAFKIDCGNENVKLEKNYCRQKLEVTYYNIQNKKTDIAGYVNLFVYVIRQLEYIENGTQTNRFKMEHRQELLNMLNVKSKILFVGFLLQERTSMLDRLNKEGVLMFGAQDVGYDKGYLNYLNALRVVCGDKPLQNIDYSDYEIDDGATKEQARKQ